MDAYTKKVKAAERFARVMLWTAAVITIGILVSIIGFILFRGFISNVREEYQVIAKGEKFINIGGSNDVRIAVILNSRVKVDDLTFTELERIFTGDITNWGLISSQDIPIQIFAQPQSTAAGKAFLKTVIENGDYVDSVQFVKTDLELIEKVSGTKGAVGFIAGESIDQVRQGNVKIVPVRSIAIVVNREVLELRDNRKLRYINESHLQSIFTGKVENWKEVGGTDLPIIVTVLNGNTAISSTFKNLALQENNDFLNKAVSVNSFEELVHTLEITPGAVGFCYFSDACRIKDQILKVERKRVRPNLTFRFLVTPPKRAGMVGGVSSIICNTLLMILLTLLFSAPVGIMAAIYLTEYAKQGRLWTLLRFGTETLAGIPSIIFGLFGFLFFVQLLKFGIGLLSGTLTITMMVLPTIIRTSEEAIKAVPVAYREGSLALGATKWQTIARSVLPPATPGILTGIILAIGRAVGETAALLFTMGTDYRLAKTVSSSARTLSVHLYILVKEGISFERAFATGTILIAIILVVNFTTNKLIGRMAGMKRSKL